MVVRDDEAGARLDRLLSDRELGYSRSALQAFIAAGRVEVDGQVARASARPRSGARVVVRPAPPPPSSAGPQDIPLDVR
jgi:23S rRNA pseudouridine1911/1915/1917 synthase